MDRGVVRGGLQRLVGQLERLGVVARGERIAGLVERAAGRLNRGLIGLRSAGVDGLGVVIDRSRVGLTDHHRLLHDHGGTPYLLLQGPEPDIRWEAFCRAVLEVVERFRVQLVVSVGSVPMAVPHTRPIAITHHANNADLQTGTSPWRGELRVPSSAQALLEVRLGEWGHDAQGFVAHVPHYLAQLDYPRASQALLEQVELAARLTIDLSELGELAEEREEEIGRYLSANDEVQDVVTALEQQYDTFARAEEEGSSLLAEDEPLPTGEEIGRQFEQFLAGLEGPEETGGGRE